MVTRVFLFFFRVSHLFSVYMYQSVCLSVTPPFSVLVVCVKTTIMNNNMLIFFVCNIVWIFFPYQCLKTSALFSTIKNHSSDRKLKYTTSLNYSFLMTAHGAAHAFFVHVLLRLVPTNYTCVKEMKKYRAGPTV